MKGSIKFFLVVSLSLLAWCQGQDPCDIAVDVTCVADFDGITDCDAFPPPVGCEDRPFEMVMRFNGGGCEQSFVQQDKFGCEDFQGGPPVEEGVLSYIVVTDLKGTGITYFEGFVAVGEDYTLSDGGNDFAADMNVTVYSSSDTSPANLLLQTLFFHSSCSQPLILADRFGAHQVVEFISVNQGTVSCFQHATLTHSITTNDDSQVDLTSLVSVTNLGVFDLTDQVAGLIVGPGAPTVVVYQEVELDLCERQRYTVVATVEGDNGECSNSALLEFDAGYPTPPNVPTAEPTESPILAPFRESQPSAAPTPFPSESPTAAPSAASSFSPTAAPSESPTGAPSAAPSDPPTAAPSAAPSPAPTGTCDIAVAIDCEAADGTPCDRFPRSLVNCVEEIRYTYTFCNVGDNDMTINEAARERDGQTVDLLPQIPVGERVLAPLECLEVTETDTLDVCTEGEIETTLTGQADPPFGLLCDDTAEYTINPTTTTPAPSVPTTPTEPPTAMPIDMSMTPAPTDIPTAPTEPPTAMPIDMSMTPAPSVPTTPTEPPTAMPIDMSMTPAPSVLTTPAPSAPMTPVTGAPTSNPIHGGSGGDPHFITFKNKRYSFHGECDLVLLCSEDFGSGIGFCIHVRTKMSQIKGQHFSFVSHVAILLGDDILEVTGSIFYINGGLNPELPSYLASHYMVYRHTEGVGTELERLVYKVELGNGGFVTITSYKQYLTVTIDADEADLWNSVGMLGTVQEGTLLARDGLTLLQDYDEVGMEWQVHPDDGALFQEFRAPQLPLEKCRMPPDTQRRRRLRATGDASFLEAAQKACLHRVEDYDLCMFDVLNTGDVGLAVVGEI